MAQRKSTETVNDWKDVTPADQADDWKDVTVPNAPVPVDEGSEPVSAGGLLRTMGRQALGAGKQVLKDALDLGLTAALGPHQYAAAPIKAKLGYEKALEPIGRSQEVGSNLGAAAEFLLPIPGAPEVRTLKGLAPMAERLYESALKPAPSMGIEPAKRIIRTLIREGIPVTEGGLQKHERALQSINENVASHIQNSPLMVSPESVANRIEQVRPKFAAQHNPESDLAALQSAKSEYLRKHTVQAPFTKTATGTEGELAGQLIPVGQGSTPVLMDIPATEAQAEKIATHGRLRGKYGELKSADIEAQKALARGSREELAKGIPEIVAPLKREAGLMEAEEPLERAVVRSQNRHLIPIGSVPVSLGQKLFDNPAVKSYGAIGMNRLSRVPYRFRGLMGGASAIDKSLLGQRSSQ